MTMNSLVASALELTADLDLDATLTKFIEAAKDQSGAELVALGILGSRGETIGFYHTGMDPVTVEEIGRPPRSIGILSLIPAEGHLIINDVANHPEYGGVPGSHTPLHNFLGLPIHIHEQVFGRLYLANKPGGFSDGDADKLEVLAAAVAIAVDNARLYQDSKKRADWISVSQKVTTALLEGTDEEEALELIAKLMREVSSSAASLIVLPSLGNTWVCEIADGEGASSLIGIDFPAEGRAQTVIREGTGLIVDSLTRSRTLRVAELRDYGPALYAPMIVHGNGVGVIILLRSKTDSEFDFTDLAMAESVAKQAALALELTAARHAQDVAAQIDERAKIGRDLHDLAIQQLFATGMRITSIKNDLEAKNADPQILELLHQAIGSVDESVTEIRQIVHRLREPDATIVVVERLRREASLARTSLSFAPSLVIEYFGEILPSEAGPEIISQIDDTIGADIADDIVAVAREGLSNAARHARASSVSVNVCVTKEHVTLTVTDDGQGFTPDRTRRSGLANLAARARRHGGTFELAQAEPKGTRMIWQAPLS